MKVIVIRQPWAWLIVNGFKDVENRSWNTRYRGTLLIQASATLPTKRNLEEFRLFARERGVELPADFERGGIRRHGAIKELRHQQRKQVI